MLGGDDDDDGPNTNGPGMASCHSGPRSAAPAGPSSRSKELLARLLAPVAAAAAPSAGLAVPTLRALCLGLLGSHVEHLAGTEDMGPHLALLPPDVKACMLCVARRRGVLSNRILLGLVDPGWAVLDLAGAAALSERAVRRALLRCGRQALRALDLSGAGGGGGGGGAGGTGGVDGVEGKAGASAGALGAGAAAGAAGAGAGEGHVGLGPELLRDLPQLAPGLEVLVLGGGGRRQQEVLLQVGGWVGEEAGGRAGGRENGAGGWGVAWRGGRHGEARGLWLRRWVLW